MPRARAGLPAPNDEVERPTVRPAGRRRAPEPPVVELWAPRYRDPRRD